MNRTKKLYYSIQIISSYCRALKKKSDFSGMKANDVRKQFMVSARIHLYSMIKLELYKKCGEELKFLAIEECSYVIEFHK